MDLLKIICIYEALEEDERRENKEKVSSNSKKGTQDIKMSSTKRKTASGKGLPAFQYIDIPSISEDLPMCLCCLATKDLRSLEKPYLYHGKNEVYSDMLSSCFSAELSADEGWICSDCVRRLRASLSFRQCVESAKKYLISQKTSLEKGKKSKSKQSKFIPEDTNSTNDAMDTDHFDDDFTGVTVKQEKIAASPKSYPPVASTVASESSSSSEDEDYFGDFVNPPEESKPPPTYNRMEFEVSELRTLPYVLGSTDRTCEICHKEFSFLGDLLKHMPEHYPNHICDICGKICATRKSFEFHIKTHNEDERHQCDKCEKSFKNKANLKIHVKVHHKGEKVIFKCNICGEVLDTYVNRLKHLAEKHDREEKAYKCLQCSCKYRLGSHLRSHIRRVHLHEKNHKCQECGVSFFSRKSLQKHSVKHTGERNIICHICNKGYGTKQSLKSHLKTHEAKQNYAEPASQLLQQQMPHPYMEEDQRYPMRTFMRM